MPWVRSGQGANRQQRRAAAHKKVRGDRDRALRQETFLKTCQLMVVGINEKGEQIAELDSCMAEYCESEGPRVEDGFVMSLKDLPAEVVALKICVAYEKG